MRRTPRGLQNDTTQAHLRDRRCRFFVGQGPDGGQPRQSAHGAWPARRHAEARPVSERRSGDDEPVPARRGLRDRRRRRDRPRHRPLRALPRHRAEPGGERHHRPDLLAGHRARAPRRVPRRHRAGHSAHHRRDQAPHAPAGRRDAEARRDHHRDRRHGRRHRVAAVHRVGPADPPRARPCERLLRARLARAVHGRFRRAEDQAHAALGRRAPLDRHPARRARAAQRPPGDGVEQAQDRAHVRRRRGRAVVNAVDVPSIYDIPTMLHEQGLDEYIVRTLGLGKAAEVDWSRWDARAAGRAQPEARGDDRSGRQVHRPAGCLPLGHRGAQGRRLRARDPRDDHLDPVRPVRDARGCRQGAGRARRHRRSGRIRHPRDRRQARRAEVRPRAGHPDARSVPGPAVHGDRVRPTCRRHRRRLVHRVRPRHRRTPSSRRWPSRSTSSPGATWAARCASACTRPSSPTARSPRELYGASRVDERHRHRYEVNNAYRDALSSAGLFFSGLSPDRNLVEYVELPREVHPYYIATQAHPELRSRPTDPHPLFRGLVGAALERHSSSELFDVENALQSESGAAALHDEPVDAEILDERPGVLRARVGCAQRHRALRRRRDRAPVRRPPRCGGDRRGRRAGPRAADPAVPSPDPSPRLGDPCGAARHRGGVARSRPRSASSSKRPI